jgi:hypothetical protein
MKQIKRRFIFAVALILTFAHVSKASANPQFCEASIEGQTTTPSDPAYVHDTDEYFQLSDS